MITLTFSWKWSTHASRSLIVSLPCSSWAEMVQQNSTLYRTLSISSSSFFQLTSWQAVKRSFVNLLPSATTRSSRRLHSWKPDLKMWMLSSRSRTPLFCCKFRRAHPLQLPLPWEVAIRVCIITHSNSSSHLSPGGSSDHQFDCSIYRISRKGDSQTTHKILSTYHKTSPRAYWA